MPTEFVKPRHYPALDGLRGVAALMILWHHFLQLMPLHGRVLSSSTQVFGFTWVGVDLFFVISGFLITGILADSKSGKNYFRKFYGRRVLRIFPLYYGLLIVVFFILPLFGGATDVGSSSKVFFWTYTSNLYFQGHGWFGDHLLTHLWTLAIEEQFYFVWPFVIFFASNLERLRKGLLWAFGSVSLLRCILFFFGADYHVMYLNTFTHCDALLLGGYLALTMRSTAPTRWKGLRPAKSVAILLTVIALLLANVEALDPKWFTLPLVAFGRDVPMFGMLAVVFVWLVYAATNNTSGRIFRFFSHPSLRWFGKYSYALYVLHVPIAFWILRAPWISSRPILAEVEYFILYFGVSITAAFLSWHLFEKHFLKLKRYFAREDEIGLPATALPAEG
ncbi:MAG TPA: acyltransferase [Candidatus Kapabacteria bacterium]|jgi:peptidoglycan/LPS O-acetylase OafA/YrhL|nr:acyltransferase [Candidatus Kapabacteria bacterium]